MAEKHYIAANEWKPVVSMYRENDMWEDCLRVAKAHGGQNAYKQVAYAFAVSVGGDAGVKLLAKRGLGEQAVDYAIERGEFTEAFHIAEKSCKGKLGEVHLQYAMALEDEGRFERAEEEFIKANKPKEAIDMYIHQQDFEQGMKVAEQHEPAAIADVQEAKGRKLAQSSQFGEAEGLFVQAKKPEVAIKMYKDAQMWDEAVRMAKKFLPRMVPDLESERLNSMSNTPMAESAQYLIDQGKQLEARKQYSEAIDVYLRVTKDNLSDYDKLEGVWENAVTIAEEFVRHRSNEVISTVTSRLAQIGKVDEAAEMWLGLDKFQQAIDVYMGAKKYEKAKAVAEDSTNPNQWMDYVNKNYQRHLVANDNMMELGRENPDAAIEIAVNRDNWEEVYSLAAQQGEGAVAKFASIHAKKLVNDSKYKQALAVLAQRGTAHDQPVNFGLYKRIAQEILAFSEDNQQELDHDAAEASQREVPDCIEQLREMLFKLCHNLKEIDPYGNDTKVFERLSLIAHFYALKIKCCKEELYSVEAKLATSLLRYVGTLPVDRAFFEAGHACKRGKVMNMAFVFLNRYVDISDLIEDPSDAVDYSDFLETDIPLVDAERPEKQTYTEELRDDVRDWVLDTAMSSNAANSQSLNQRLCKCGQRTYEAALKCHTCQAECEPCIVTGYPIERDQKVCCTSCQHPANREDWNAYIFKMKCCPWCGNLQEPQYSSGLGGGGGY